MPEPNQLWTLPNGTWKLGVKVNGGHEPPVILDKDGRVTQYQAVIGQVILMNAKKRIALVIGSGGIKCAAAIGMWRVLQEEGIQIGSVVGCSGGSMYGALIARGYTLLQVFIHEGGRKGEETQPAAPGSRRARLET